jgi:hypothetical protein
VPVGSGPKGQRRGVSMLMLQIRSYALSIETVGADEVTIRCEHWDLDTVASLEVLIVGNIDDLDVRRRHWAQHGCQLGHQGFAQGATRPCVNRPVRHG